MKLSIKIIIIVFFFFPHFAYTQNQSNDNLTNVIFYEDNFVPTNPLEFYEQSTSVNFVRRTEAIFFISIPFAYLFTNILYTLMPYGSVFSAYFDGVRGSQLRGGNFSYNRENKPAYETVSNPYYIALWVNTTVWPAGIAINSFVERAIDPKVYQSFRRKIINNRAPLQRIFQNQF